MIQNSKITISTIQFDVDADEVITVSYPGEYFFHNGKHYVKYIEPLEDSAELQKHQTETIIKIDGNRVEVKKKGLIEAHMLYEPGIKNTTYYESPAGKLLMNIQTDRVKIVEKETMVKVIMGYQLSLNEAFLSKCRMTIVVEKQDDNTCRI
jgi:uncharacterized beta-barrel protein YwiB (DUF1934 family)